MSEQVDLSVPIAGLTLCNPVLAASGCANYGRELGALYPLSELGAIVVKGTSLDPWDGNPGRRIAETAAGMLNAIGLQNPGIQYVVSSELPWLRQQKATVIVNIVGRTEREYAEVAQRLQQAPAGSVAGIELNISCPNVREGGIEFGRDVGAAAAVTAAVRTSTTLPLLVKLSPNVTDIASFARAVVAAGADGITVINTVVGMQWDIYTQQPVLSNRTGGLSGPAIMPIALRMVWEVACAVSVPVIGVGGIASAQDAIQFLLAGASAIQVGTAIFDDPWAPLRIRQGIASYVAQRGLGSVRALLAQGNHLR